MNITRRTALGTILAAPVGIAGLSYAQDRSSTEGEVESSQGNTLTLTAAGYTYDRVAALVDGRVKIEGCELSFTKDSIGNPGHAPGTPWDVPATPWGPLIDHKNHIMTNIQRQKLSMAVSEPAC